MAQFYSYLWLREDESPYYVGKGSGRRAYISHGKFYPPRDKSLIVIFPQDSEAEAFESEIALIWLFGRKDLGTGCLYNSTAGGEGLSGYRHTASAKQKQSAAKIGNKHSLGAVRSPEFLAKLSARTKGRKASAELRAKLSAAHKGKPNNCTGRPVSAETREKIRNSLIGRPVSAETIAKIRTTVNLPEIKAKACAAQRARREKKASI